MAIGSTILGGVLGLKASSDNKKLANKNLAAQQQNWGELKTAASPYLETGNDALKQLSAPQENFETSPGYEFRKQEGTQGVLGSQALSGMLNSGGAAKALGKYISDYSGNEYGNWFGQQLSRANLGSQGLSSMGTALSGTSQAINNNTTNMSAANNQGYDAIGGAVGGLATNPNVNKFFSTALSRVSGAGGSSGGSSYTMPATGGVRA